MAPLAALTELHTLELSNNRLQAVACASLVSLEELWLNDNPIEEETHLADLAALPRLQTLYLASSTPPPHPTPPHPTHLNTKEGSPITPVHPLRPLTPPYTLLLHPITPPHAPSRPLPPLQAGSPISKLPDYVHLVLGLAPSSLNQLDADLVLVHRQRAQRAEPPAGPPAALLVEQPLAETRVEAPAEPPVGQQAEPQGEGAGASETGRASNAPV